VPENFYTPPTPTTETYGVPVHYASEYVLRDDYATYGSPAFARVTRALQDGR